MSYNSVVGDELDLTAVERAGVEKALQAVESQVTKRADEGLSTWTFFAGVVNSGCILWCFSKYPQHFWIFYLLETLILFPMRWNIQTRTKPLESTAYWLDFCWIANFSGNVMIVIFLIDDFAAGSTAFPEWFRKLVFGMCWGVAVGPLVMAAGALGNALIFHDANNTVSTFIHLFPALALYTLRWHAEAVKESWAHLFELDYFQGMQPFRDIYLPALLFYVIWFVPYTIWLLASGLRFPSKGKDTIFHANMRGSFGSIISCSILGKAKDDLRQRVKNNDFTSQEAIIYMIFHGVSVCVTALVSIPAFYFWQFHAALCGGITLLTVYNAASRYNYYLMTSYTSIVRKQLAQLGADLPAKT